MWYEQFGGKASDPVAKMLHKVLKNYLLGRYATFQPADGGTLTEEIAEHGFNVILHDSYKNNKRHLMAAWNMDEIDFYTHWFHGTIVYGTVGRENQASFELPTLVYDAETLEIDSNNHMLFLSDCVNFNEQRAFRSPIQKTQNYYQQTVCLLKVTDTSITQRSWTAESLLEADLPRELERIVLNEEPVTHKLWGYYLGKLYLA